MATFSLYLPVIEMKESFQESQPIRKDPDAGKDLRQEEKGAIEDEMDGIIDSMDMNLSKLPEIVKDREPGVLQSRGSQRGRHD